MKKSDLEEYVKFWMENHRKKGLLTSTSAVQLIEDFLQDSRGPARRLVARIYMNPDMKGCRPVSVEQAYRDGFYSVRDTEEFEQLVEFTKGF